MYARLQAGCRSVDGIKGQEVPAVMVKSWWMVLVEAGKGVVVGESFPKDI